MFRLLCVFSIVVQTFFAGQSRAQVLLIEAGDASGLQGATVTVLFTVNNFDDILSAQGSIHFDPDVVQFVSTSNYALPGLNSSAFGTTQSSTGLITFSWFDSDLSGESLADGATIFSIQFSLIGNSGETSIVDINGVPAALEFANNLFLEVLSSANAGLITITSSPGPQAVTLTVGRDTVDQGATAYVPVCATRFEEMLSMQGSMQFDTSIVSFSGIDMFGLPSFSASNFGLTQAANGILTFSWYDPALSGVSVAEDAVLFRLLFTAKSVPGGATAVSFAETPVACEFVDTSYSPVSSTLLPGQVAINNTPNPLDNMLMWFDSTEVAHGGIASASALVASFTDVLSLQGSICFDTAVVIFDSVSDYNLSGLDISSFGLTNAVNGVITVSWYDATLSGISKSDGAAIFRLYFTARGNAGEHSDVQWTDVPTIREVTDVSLTSVEVDYVSGRIDIVDYHDINILNLADTVLCVGDTIQVSFIAEGEYADTNRFELYLSDYAGDFSAAIKIGEFASDASGTIQGIIPTGLSESLFYKIRVNATAPEYVGNESLQNFAVHPLPSVSAGSDATICNGQTAVLVGSGSGVLQWDGSVLNDSLIVSPAISEFHMLSSTSAFGCSVFDSAEVIVYDLPTVDAGSDEEMCAGDTVTLSATGANTYLWSDLQAGQSVDFI
ncbi:MAG: hypothetical protein KKA07_16145, partial [Bacteroidetes bacterium]|nr:hypothetical protein [Bacteroidota bacterium]